MTIIQLGFLALMAVVIGQLKKGRDLALLGFSVFVLFWLQPSQEFTSLLFWLPIATLALTILAWVLVSTPQSRNWKLNWRAMLVIAGVIFLVDLNQFLGFDVIYMTTTPRIWMVAAALGIYSLLLIFISRYLDKLKFLLTAVFIAIILILVYIKTPILVSRSFEFVYTLRGQETSEGMRYFLPWLGFSYFAFRLIHTLRDFQTGRLPGLTLAEYVNYVIFFPSLAAGPIDRAERFVQDLRTPASLAGQDWLEAGTRFFIGMTKKFVIADSIALFALNDVLVGQVHSAGWMWFFLYMYSLRIYLDFSGYTDVALGLARVMGIRLPENFASPYLKPNLTLFWNSWHITLTQWFRAYFFNPMTRWLRTRNYTVVWIIFTTQISTMILIGLWHGVTWSFLLWGLWHGLGLFVQNRWSEWMRMRLSVPSSPQAQLLLNASGIFLTFNFVSLGWLFFTLSTPQLAFTAMAKLFGVAP